MFHVGKLRLTEVGQACSSSVAKLPLALLVSGVCLTFCVIFSFMCFRELTVVVRSSSLWLCNKPPQFRWQKIPTNQSLIICRGSWGWSPTDSMVCLTLTLAIGQGLSRGCRLERPCRLSWLPRSLAAGFQKQMLREREKLCLIL